MFRHLLSLLICVVMASFAYGQEVQFPVYNSVITFEHLPPEAPSPPRDSETDNYWCAFSSYMRSSLYAQLQTLNVKSKCYGKYHGGYVYHLNIVDNFDNIISLLRNCQFFVNILPVSVADKLDERIWEQRDLQYINPVQQTIKVDVYFHDRMSQSEMETVIISYVDSIIPASDLEYDNKINAIATCDQIIELAGRDEISTIIPWQPEDYMIYLVRELLKVNEVQAGHLVPLEPPTTDWMVDVPFTGDSIWFWNGEYSATSGNYYHHLDFFEFDGTDTVFRDTSTVKSTWSLPAFGFTPHGLQTAAVAVGNGWASTQSLNHPTTDLLRWRGIAPKALIIPGSGTFSGDVNNRSFTEYGHWYTQTSQRLDDRTSLHESISPDFNNVIVTGPGNNGVKDVNVYNNKPQIGYYSCLMESKNTINAGSIERYGPELAMAAYSGMGPTRDGRIKPDFLVPATGFGRDEWDIAFDSIALVNNGVKYVWNFTTPTDPTWGVFKDHGNIIRKKQEGGCLSFTAWDRGWMFSDQMTPIGSVISNVNDTLVMHLSVDGVDHPQAMDHCRFQLYWKTPSDAYAKRVAGDFCRIIFDVPVNDNFYDLRIPIGDTNVVDYTGGPWIIGDTLESIRFDFLTINWGIVSCKPSDTSNFENEYSYTWGNSIAAPITSGIVALMLQKYRDEVIRPFNVSVGIDSLNIHDNPMWNSTARGILIHTAVDMVDTVGIRGGAYNPEFLAHGDSSVTVYWKGPDWATGWGFANVKKALEYVDTTKFVERTIAQHDSLTFCMYVPEDTDSLRTTICWDDPEHRNTTEAAAFIKKLMNDLRVYMRHKETGSIENPWVIDHNWMNTGVIPTNGIDSNITKQLILDNPGYKGVDTVNNVEVVDINSPLAGIWEIIVTADSISEDQHLDQPIDTIMDQDFSLIFDFPLIDDTSKTTWIVDANGHGDFLTIDDAVEFLADRDNNTIAVNPGDFEIDKYVTAGGDNCVLQFQAGTNVTIISEDAGIYFPSGTSRILGAENITLEPQVLLYNTPEPRQPLPRDNLIGLFANINKALDVSTPAKTVCAGPGEFNSWGPVIEEGIIGTLDPSDPTNPEKNTIIYCGFGRETELFGGDRSGLQNYPDLIKNLRIFIDDEAPWSDDDVAGIWGSNGTIVEGCSFENINSAGAIKTSMFSLGRDIEPLNAVVYFTNCSFKGFDKAIKVWEIMTEDMAPVFQNTDFEANTIDITFREAPPDYTKAYCKIESTRLNKILLASVLYEDSAAIQALINANCTPYERGNISPIKLYYVDELASDFRLSRYSPLIDAAENYEDIGAYPTDMVYTFSRFLDAKIVFSSKDTVKVVNGSVIKNTFGSAAVFQSITQTNLRPVYRIIVKKNCLDNGSTVRLRVNDYPAVPPLPADYVLMDAMYNGVVCGSLTYQELPDPCHIVYVNTTPDNVPPAEVTGITATQQSYGVEITWDENIESDLSRYKVYRFPSGDPDDAEQIASIDKNVTLYVDSTGDISIFDYAVVAYDYTGNQSYSVIGPPPLWVIDKYYEVGDIVSYDGKIWKCKFAHTSQENWYPGAPGIWFWVEQITTDEWILNEDYDVDDLVTYNGKLWKCTYAHTSQIDWYPGAPGIWFWVEQ